MGYDFTIGKHYRPKAEKDYSWPCGALPNRTITLYPDDVLTLQENGAMMKHTGLGCMNIRVPLEDLIEHAEPVRLRLL